LFLEALAACYICAESPSKQKSAEDGKGESSDNTDRDNLFLIVLKSLTHGETELQAEAFECLRTVCFKLRGTEGLSYVHTP